MLKRATKLIKIQLLILLLLAGCARLKQCAYEGFTRDQWQQRDRVVESLEINPGDRVADIGSGGGYFVFALAKAVGPNGKVYAVDIDKEMNDLVAQRLKQEGVKNVEVILAKPDDPLLPSSGVDLIFTSNTYHHIDNRVSYFKNLRKYLRPNGRIAIIEFDRRGWFAGLWKHYTPSEFIKRELEQAGYSLQSEFTFLDRQSFLIFASHPPAEKQPRANQRKQQGSLVIAVLWQPEVVARSWARRSSGTS